MISVGGINIWTCRRIKGFGSSEESVGERQRLATDIEAV
jgi:hypothetical protein